MVIPEDWFADGSRGKVRLKIIKICRINPFRYCHHVCTEFHGKHPIIEMFHKKSKTAILVTFEEMSVDLQVSLINLSFIHILFQSIFKLWRLTRLSHVMLLACVKVVERDWNEIMCERLYQINIIIQNLWSPWTFNEIITLILTARHLSKQIKHLTSLIHFFSWINGKL